MHVVLLISLIATELAFGTPRLSENAALHKKRKVFVMGLILFLFAALRHETVGIDVFTYVEEYEQIARWSIDEIVDWRKDRDPFFYIFAKGLTVISRNPQFLLIVIGAVVAISFSYFAYHQQGNTLMLYILFITFRMYAFTLTGLRQAMALAICWIAFVKLQQGKTFWFLLLTIFASQFHASALAFLCAWPFYWAKKPFLSGTLCLSVAVVDLATGHRFLAWVTSSLFKEDRFEGYTQADKLTEYSGGGTFYLYLFFFAFVIFAMAYAKQRFEQKEQFDRLFCVACLAVMTSIMGRNVPALFRISYYFLLPFYAAISPSIKAVFNKRDTTIIYTVIMVLLCAQYIVLTPGAGINNYRFFWS